MNLTEIVCRENDTAEDLARKVRLATILGTFQSTLTDFPYLRKIWRKNTEEERLLGVSMTGIMDCNLLIQRDKAAVAKLLRSLRGVAVETNAEFADALGIEHSAAITCVKPSGTVSQLVDSASGIHARHSPYYIRTVRADVKDPLTQFLKAAGFPYEPAVDKPDSTFVFSFPQKSPEGAVTRNDMSAIEQLENWLLFQENWCEHKPSVTISVRDHEWLEVGAWVYANFDAISGVSFLPYSDHVYKQAPYQDCTEEEYLAFLEKMPHNVNWPALSHFEDDDFTAGMQTMACSSGACELVDLE